MTRRSLVLALLLSLLAVPLVEANGLPVATPEQVGLSSERLARIGNVLRADVERGRIPGAVVLVARKGRVAYLEAVGLRDKAAGAPMTPDAIFRLASMTKPMVTVARAFSRPTPSRSTFPRSASCRSAWSAGSRARAIESSTPFPPSAR
jgi:CubicO group peptidase (beta-lactamase class C family)